MHFIKMVLTAWVMLSAIGICFFTPRMLMGIAAAHRQAKFRASLRIRSGVPLTCGRFSRPVVRVGLRK
jgi:hypothetical protein